MGGVKQNIQPNMVLLNKILSNQEIIISKIKKIDDQLSKIDLITNNLLTKHTLTTQRISLIENKLDTMMKPKGWWYN
tara:strand:- start:530 stop:760 length:231 start_codon:yes stop_codon:yes gene_type:complete